MPTTSYLSCKRSKHRSHVCCTPEKTLNVKFCKNFKLFATRIRNSLCYRADMKHHRLSLKITAQGMTNLLRPLQHNVDRCLRLAQHRTEGTLIPDSIITMKTILSLTKSFKFPRLRRVINFKSFQ